VTVEDLNAERVTELQKLDWIVLGTVPTKTWVTSVSSEIAEVKEFEEVWIDPYRRKFQSFWSQSGRTCSDQYGRLSTV
jgi:hypothetical protein